MADTKESEVLTFNALLTLLGGRSRQSIYDLMRRYPTFPEPRQIGSGFSVGWLRGEVMDWLQTRPPVALNGLDAVEPGAGRPGGKTTRCMIRRLPASEDTAAGDEVGLAPCACRAESRDEWRESMSYEELAHEMQEPLEKALPSMVIAVGQPIQHRVDELISGVRAPLVLRIYGEKLEALDRLSTEIKDVLEGVRGASDLAVEANRGKPQITVVVDRSAAARYGLSVEEVLEVVRAGVGGKAVGTVFDGARRFDMQLWFKPEFRNSVETIGNLPPG